MIPSFLLPAGLPLRPSSMALKGQCLFIKATAFQSYSSCPVCGWNSCRIHSRYLRRLTDLPTSGLSVEVTVITRKYFCDNPRCGRKIFTERFNQEIVPYHRRFNRCKTLLANIALELGGNKGALISRMTGLLVSPSTILRIIKRMTLEVQKVTSGIIGVDDWAFKKGNTYGTIIVDLEENKVVDLLCDRESETLCTWLKDHPEVKVVSRDRGGPYAKGARDGAPQAIQVADRFHLLMNLGEATKRMFQSLGTQIKEVCKGYYSPRLAVEVSPSMEVSQRNSSEITPSEQCKNPQGQLRFEKVKELYRLGHPIRAIARSLHIQRTTIRKYIATDTLPDKRGIRSTNFEFFQMFLLHEDNKGKTHKALYHMIKARGFSGGYSQFCNNLNELLRTHNRIAYTCKPDPAPLKTFSPRQLSVLLLTDKKDLKKEDSEFLELLFHKCPIVKETQGYILGFKNLFQTKEDGALKKWIYDVAKSNCGVKGFARGLQSDYDAANNAVVTAYSNGPVEGQINRLKNIKRRMYGKAGFELLRRMVIFKSG